MNIFILDDTIDFLMDQVDYLEHIDEIERLKMESNTIKAGLGLIDSNNETIFSKDIFNNSAILYESLKYLICSRSNSKIDFPSSSFS